MKKPYNRYIALLLAIFLCSLSLVSCDKGDNDSTIDSGEEAIESEAETVQLTSSGFGLEADKLMSNSSKLTEIGDEYIELILELDVSLCADYCVKVQTSGTEADQYGVFLCNSESDAKTLAGQLDTYLATLRESWENFDYLPEEAPKIAASEVKTNGSAVCYVIASDSEKKAVFDMFSSCQIISE